MSMPLGCRELLQQELERRRKKNPAYSTRAFARDIGLSSAYCSQVLNGKRVLTEERAVQVARRIGWDLDRSRLLTTLTRYEAAKNPATKEAILLELSAMKLEAVPFFQMKIDTFRVISDWYHYALLELTTLKDFSSSSTWIAERLGITVTEARLAIARLKRLGLLESKNGRLRKTYKSYSTGDVPSEAIRSYHKQVIGRASQAIEKQGVNERDFSSITVAINRKRLERAKEMIRKFRHELMEFLETDENGKDSVYQLAVQLFRLDGGHS